MTNTPCECVIPNGGYCPRHSLDKPAHWVHLCQTKPKYFDAWEAGRGPGNPVPPRETKPDPHYLLCPRRGQVLATVSARKAGCGCGSSRVDVYQCELFDEPVLKKAAARCLADIAELVPAYTGRTCRECAEFG